MNSKTSLIFFGLITLIVGIIPLVTKTFPSTADSLKFLPLAGSYGYQAIIILIGIIALLLSGSPKKKHKMVYRE